MPTSLLSMLYNLLVCLLGSMTLMPSKCLPTPEDGAHFALIPYLV
jgi:hypothetical protein